jgi:hypothetical protein
MFFMLRLLLRLVILVVAVMAAGVLLLGWWPGGGWLQDSPLGGRIAERPVVADEVRAAGARAGEKAADVAAQAQHALSSGSITAKIKAKMALDDLVRAREIDVDFADGVVTLTGRVTGQAEHTRAVSLARETAGVTRVVDKLVVVVGGR